ncbi:MAG: indole-3-glycerol phosphate synthase TrpC [Clostridia bacterium]|nr:indole-3-glycerol phosphate synthase TrpC [Clostridia bacterium]MBR2288998.1 indole-3-glycerol phosphate synthase TrpC [Clostridia bacterium]
MSDILETIAASNRLRIAEAKALVPFSEVRAQAEAMGPLQGFPFEKALSGETLAFICECKKASPSKGLIAPDFPYLEIARSYAQAGAEAISVLTEPKWFLGSNEILREITENVSTPVLRKDFTVDEYMIYEARLLGASAVLLIVSLLDEKTLSSWIRLSDSLGLSCLVECHDAEEIRMALGCGARIIGVNNRNLRTFSVDVSHAGALRSLVPGNVTFVAESGIRDAADVRAVAEEGADAVLVGETLMRAADKKAKLSELRGGARA